MVEAEMEVVVMQEVGRGAAEKAVEARAVALRVEARVAAATEEAVTGLPLPPRTLLAPRRTRRLPRVPPEPPRQKRRRAA